MVVPSPMVFVSKSQIAMEIAMLHPTPGRPGRGYKSPSTRLAEEAGISRVLVARARLVAATSPSAATKVRAGEMSLDEAYYRLILRKKKPPGGVRRR